MGWFIFTFLLLICTLRSTVAFFTLFFTLDMAFLMLGLAYLLHSGGAPHTGLLRAGGAFGILSAFTAWYVSALISDTLCALADSIQGTTPSPVWPTPATRSSSSLSPTSRGPTRAVRSATRLTTAPLALRCKPSSFLFQHENYEVLLRALGYLERSKECDSDRPLWVYGA